MPKMSILEEIMEVILYVEDMGAAVSFYRDTLEFEVGYPAGLDDYSDQPWVTFKTGACTLALHAGGKGRLGGDAPKIVFRVADIGAARQALLDRGVQVDPVRAAAPGVWVCDFSGPEGHKLSIEAHD